MSSGHESILVLGGTGLLGSHLLAGNYFQGYRLFGHGRSLGADISADLEDIEQVREMLAQTAPTVIINLVGLTNVDLCERFPNEAYKINIHTLQNVVEAAKSLPIKPRLIHISTDQVYDGPGLHEEGQVTLTNYYAFSKYAAELVATAAKGIVFRTNFFGKSQTAKRKSLTDWLYQELSTGNDIQVFDDVLFSPLSLQCLCEVIGAAVKSDLYGIFNLGSHNGMSKADFAYQFAEHLGLPKTSMTRVNSSNVDFLKTYRPKDMRMDIRALEKAMKIKLPSLTAEIERVAREYRK